MISYLNSSTWNAYSPFSRLEKGISKAQKNTLVGFSCFSATPSRMHGITLFWKIAPALKYYSLVPYHELVVHSILNLW